MMDNSAGKHIDDEINGGAINDGNAGDGNAEAPKPVIAQLSKREYRQYLFTATLTALMFALIISGGMILFVLFCVFVWL